VIFPFEEPLYRDAGISVQFVGHPLIDLARVTAPRDVFLAELGCDPTAPVVALLPGSRPNELRHILPDLARAAAIVATRIPRAQFLVARAPRLDDELFAPVTTSGALRGRVHVVDGRADDVLSASDVVLTASGTATVQAAIHERPMVIVYRLSPLTYRLLRHAVRVRHFGMVNLVAGEQVVPELAQDAFTPQAVADEAVSFLTDADRAGRVRAALKGVRASLGGPGASRRAAEAVLAVARRRREPERPVAIGAGA
jgi:lipid-A-disaccharide synthase